MKAATNIMRDSVPLDDNSISVCICTYRRSHLLTTIDSVAKQQITNSPTTRIIVIDNDISPSAKSIVDAYCANKTINLTYIHAPAQNISVARNAAIDAATTRWLAFIDDDERASPTWLADFWATRSGSHAVFGRCKALYHPDTPVWIKEGDYHSSPITNKDAHLDTGYTSNVLIDMEFVRQHGIRFDTSLGRTGGEDSIFFHIMYRNGAVLKYAPCAVVYEDVAPSRINLTWIATHKFRAGQTYAMMFNKFDKAAYRRVSWSAPLKISGCIAMLALTAINRRRAMWWLVRGVFHCGVLSYSLGMAIHQEYAS
jgi:succinoglycan biosynthesis protein ExoM